MEADHEKLCMLYLKALKSGEKSVLKILRRKGGQCLVYCAFRHQSLPITTLVYKLISSISVFIFYC